MEEKYISLKEAAEISGYAPDYIGQLIRAGKISGKQVYTNVSWMTTAEAVLGYKNKPVRQGDKRDQTNSFFTRQIRKIKLEIEVLKQILRAFRSFLPTISVFILSLFIFLLLLFNYLATSRANISRPDAAETINNSITF